MDKKLVVITGAGSGIGKAIALLFSKKGYPLLLIDRSGRSSELGIENAICEKVDVSNLETFQNAVNKAEAKFGPVDCMINNAGCMLLSNIAGQDPKEWQRMIDVNIMGVLNGVKTVVQGMKNKKTGTIINVSSVAGKKTFPNHAAYCATKFAIHGFTENLREELAKDNVRCVTIAPGVVETELLSHTSHAKIVDGYSAWKDNIGGALDPNDVAEAVLFAYDKPQNVCIREIVLAPTRQEP